MLSHLKNIVLALLALLSLPMVGCTEAPPAQAEVAAEQVAERPVPAPPASVSPADHRELKKFLASHGYDWDTLANGVPAFILEILPADLDRIPQLSEKKRIFFLSLLPMVLMANEEILSQREELIRLLQLHQETGDLSAEQRAWIESLARSYRVSGDPLNAPGARKRLLKRVDIIPPSMALAQAANESGYGTSRFARLANNLFGEWTFSPGTGLVPKDRPAGSIYEVRRFATLYDSVRSYFRNINTHRAYSSLRKHRAEARAAGLPLRGIDLAEGLTLYSARKEAYVEEIRAIIRSNDLHSLATAALRNS